MERCDEAYEVIAEEKEERLTAMRGQLWHNEAMLIRAKERQQDSEVAERMLRHRLRRAEAEVNMALQRIRELELALAEAAENY